MEGQVVVDQVFHLAIILFIIRIIELAVELPI